MTDMIPPPDDPAERHVYYEGIWASRETMVTILSGVMILRGAADELGKLGEFSRWLSDYARRHPERREQIAGELAWLRACELGGDAVENFDPYDRTTWPTD